MSHSIAETFPIKRFRNTDRDREAKKEVDKPPADANPRRIFMYTFVTLPKLVKKRSKNN